MCYKISIEFYINNVINIHFKGNQTGKQMFPPKIKKI